MQNFVGKTKCIVGYMKVADICNVSMQDDMYGVTVVRRENVHIKTLDTKLATRMSEE